jgi:hypothetical protein
MPSAKALRRALACGALCLAVPGLLLAAERPHVLPGGSNAVAHPVAGPISVQPATAAQLIQCLLGPGVQVSNVVLNAAPDAAGVFSGGAGVIGVDQGIVLSTGNVNTLVGPNLANDTTTDNLFPGDPQLDALIPGYTTHDAASLEFDFTCDNPTQVSFEFVFGSEEYNEWVTSEFNDVFGFFLNGVNIAVTPATCATPGLPVAVNNVNCGNPYAPPSGVNCGCYRNNALPEGGGLINTELDGLTQVFYATGTIHPGVNHMKIAIADAGDQVLDSDVMIACQTFVCAAPPSTGACCMGPGDDCFQLSQAQCLAEGGRYHGDGTLCSPNPCEPTPAPNASWGRVKNIYR